jgi:hypothetical protein
MLLDILFELPSRRDQTQFVVDAEIVRKTKSLARGLTTDADDAEDSDAAAEPGTGKTPRIPRPGEKRESA